MLNSVNNDDEYDIMKKPFVPERLDFTNFGEYVMSEKNKDCRCPYTNCPRNGNCEACNAYHNGDTHCKKNPPMK